METKETNNKWSVGLILLLVIAMGSMFFAGKIYSSNREKAVQKEIREEEHENYCVDLKSKFMNDNYSSTYNIYHFKDGVFKNKDGNENPANSPKDDLDSLKEYATNCLTPNY